MNHLSDDLIYTLAVKVIDETELSEHEEDALMHVAQCDDCYHLLNAMMTMLEVSRDLGKFAVEPEAVAIEQPVRERIRAVLKLAVSAVSSALDQITAGADAWTFRRPPALLAGARGFGKRSSVQKLTDLQNTQNFVAYDPDKKLLVIQLDAAAYSDAPKASLMLPDGTVRDIAFEKQDDIFWAEVTDLEDGNYEITLEK